MRVKKINRKRLVDALLLAAPIAAKANYEWPKHTFDYDIGEDLKLEVEFLKDLFEHNTDYIMEKWYGGKELTEGLLDK
ncbi:hypothetical protein [Paenibacillus segetis]|uniref:Uncharacterized protein n=1 Tax=Paenibacillus segetis TaxID=1325360 RepID=A0ABQ1Y4H3_9BACL|nr:hypothetical protein [Paenibacillus segetis]GGH12444.1 hypothetical protein GCM10008013_04870 [Paenibacillus segetis]